ncbi:MALD2 protein, partial [Urocolius indicus]|nr:MALD2 protein [Urocolius indicus]
MQPHFSPILCVLKPPPASARHVVFEDEVMPLRRPSRKILHAEEGEKPRAGSIPLRLPPQPHTIPDYVVKYPAIRSPQQREGYKGVFQDQRAEYTELLGELPWSVGQDLALLEKQQQRCEYLKKKLTHIKARIQEYDRGRSVYF